MPNKAQPQTTGVILMTYGSATAAENVPKYMHHIYKDKIPEGLVDDFAERYRLVGRSPLVDITNAQAAELEKVLNPTESNTRPRYVVRAGMLHSEPFIDTAVADCRAAGVERIVGIILSPQFSSFIMDGYRTALHAATAKHGYRQKDLTIAGPWPTQRQFIELLANRTTASLTNLHAMYGPNVPVIFTTHSLPERVVAKDPDYLDQLKRTTAAVVANLKKPTPEWHAAYQSAGHTPEAWLKPDLVDVLAQLHDQHAPAVLIVPIQFLANHLEILYDLDIAGAEQCLDHGLAYNRIELPNAAPLFIEALASVVKSAKVR